MIGRIKTFRPRDYGSVTADGEDYLFRSNQWEYKTYPRIGEIVEFEAEETSNGMKAANIRRNEHGK